MKENFFISMLSETGKVSVKRAIALLFAIVAVTMALYLMLQTRAIDHNLIFGLYFGLLAIILLMTGVATVKDIIAFRYGNKDKDNSPDSVSELPRP